ncbi:gp22 scaffold prohead core protein [Synechococcus phage S-MbCM6]|nr:gp22 scaffold prohead core protein [Synechococcus phage ACG-2014c]AFD02724.1 gp22 scaffold prohead core protein [Synechococcus phage ACG-2014c]
MEIVSECAAGLAETQKEKLASLAEGVEFETEEDFRNKVETIKESYFTRKAVVESTEPTEDRGEILVEDTTSGTMSKYVDALKMWSN